MKIPLLLCAMLACAPLQVLAEDAAPPATENADKNLPDGNGVRPATRALFAKIYAEVDEALLKKDALASAHYWAENFRQVDSDGNINDRATAFAGLQQSAAQLPALDKVSSQINSMRRLETADGSERYVIQATTTIEADLKNAAGTIRKLKASGQTREVWQATKIPPDGAIIYQQIVSIELFSQTFLDGVEIPL